MNSHRSRISLPWALVLILGVAALPVGGAIAASIMKVNVVNRVDVQESGAKVIKMFDKTLDSEEVARPTVNLEGFKTVRLTAFATVNGQATSLPWTTAGNCSAGDNKLSLVTLWGTGKEAGETAGLNWVIPDVENLSTYQTFSADLPVLRPKLTLQICNASPNDARIAIYLYALRN